ncbi:MAG: YbaK/EbsC family protein [Rhodospirillales bacterium]|nr:YbaK/EbsC family protein [Rhodospirillales bacterium]
MGILENEPVKRVRAALLKAGLADSIVELAATARSAEDAAAAIGCPLGAIVKSLVFAIDQRMVMALIAGDHLCHEAALGPALNLTGPVRRPQASEVKGATGFTIGGIPPVGLSHRLPVVIDRSLKRFDVVYAAAGHPHCVFASDVASLGRLTGGVISAAIGVPMAPETVDPISLKPSRSFAENRQQRARGGA